MARFRLLFAALLLFGFAVQANAQDAPVASATTWLIVRHADKDDQEMLSEAGKARAESLARVTSLFRVKAIYSTDYPRTKDTAKPTANKLQLDVVLYDPKPDQQWFDELKQKHAGETVLIVGHSNTIGRIAKGFGAKDEIVVDDSDYANLLIVTTDGDRTSDVRLKFGK